MKGKPAFAIYGTIEWEVSKDNKILRKGRQRMHSFVNNFMKYLVGLFTMPKETSPIETVTAEATYHVVYIAEDMVGIDSIVYPPWAGTALDTSSPYALSILGVKAPSGIDTYGILIGSGTTAPTPDDTRLQSGYPHGTGAGYFQYGEVLIEGPTVSGNTITIKIVRGFTNPIDTEQVINECGLVARHCWRLSRVGGSYPGADFCFLIARDVLSPSITVPGHAALTIRYVLTVTT